MSISVLNSVIQILLKSENKLNNNFNRNFVSINFLGYGKNTYFSERFFVNLLKKLQNTQKLIHAKINFQ